MNRFFALACRSITQKASNIIRPLDPQFSRKILNTYNERSLYRQFQSYHSSSAVYAANRKGNPPPLKDSTETKDSRTVDEIISSIDTKLTPEQMEHVNELKRKIRGGPNSPRCKSIFSLSSMLLALAETHSTFHLMLNELAFQHFTGTSQDRMN
jgi:hypothetical protein